MNQGMVLAHTPFRTMESGETTETEEADEEDRDLIPLTPEEAEALDPSKIIWKFVKMSKSKRNVVTPDAMAEKYGADSLRVYELFVAPFEDSVQWSEDGMNGAFRFLNRVWRLVTDNVDVFDPNWRDALKGVDLSAAERDMRRKTHQTIQKVTADIERFHFNTAVSALMEMLNAMHDFQSTISHSVLSEAIESLILLLGPITPHVADELWERLGKSGTTYEQTWPSFDSGIAQVEEITLILQINGKVRDRLQVPAGTDAQELERIAMESDRVKSFLEGKPIRKVIVIPEKLVNIVV
jgi:leucyl-tRNA synthetase